MLGNYITRPINMLEEGLLAILNGQRTSASSSITPSSAGSRSASTSSSTS